MAEALRQLPAIARQRSILKRTSSGGSGGSASGGSACDAATAPCVKRAVSWNDDGGERALADVREFEPR